MKISIKKFIKNKNFIYQSYLYTRQLTNGFFMPDERFLKKKFKKEVGRELDLINPQKYNDKLQWLKVNWRDSLATKCADKFEVREIVKEKIGKEYLNELIDVYESVEEIDVRKLPEKFVLKGTHGSGYNIICKDKYMIDWGKEYKLMRRWLNTNYYWHKREWVYKDIKPRIICEKYLEEFETGELRDYKIFCFNGEPKVIEVDYDRFKNHKRNFYDLDWNFINGEIRYPNDVSVNIEKPEKLSEMLDLSRILSAGFPHVRVDFYYLNNQIMFGELTFFHESGMGRFEPEEFEVTMGKWLELPRKNGGEKK